MPTIARQAVLPLRIVCFSEKKKLNFFCKYFSTGDIFWVKDRGIHSMTPFVAELCRPCACCPMLCQFMFASPAVLIRSCLLSVLHLPWLFNPFSLLFCCVPWTLMVDFGEDLPFKAECSKVILPQIFYTIVLTACFFSFCGSSPQFHCLLPLSYSFGYNLRAIKFKIPAETKRTE